jgi:DUF4097 and DUF4098 domain-containing protein YvlB
MVTDGVVSGVSTGGPMHVGTGSVVRVSGRSTRVELRGAPGDELSVEGGEVSVQPDGSIDVEPRESTVRIVCPEHAHLVISTASGTVRVIGHVADVRVITQSGSVEIERAVDADVRTVSGRVVIEAVVHTCRVVTKSGKVSVGAVHDVAVSTASASVSVVRAAVASIQTVSGAVSVGCAALARVTARSMSGNVDISVPAGSPATMELTSTNGRIRRDVPDGEGATLEVQTVSGAIRVASQ